MMKRLTLAVMIAAAAVRLYAQDFKAYQNYDFVPGDQILFDDDFAKDPDGEFPAHWKLEEGQGVVNKVEGQPALVLTQGNYVKVAPRMKTATYLPAAFTLEFDFYVKPDSTPRVLVNLDPENGRRIVFGPEPYTDGLDKDLQGSYKGDPEQFANRWHHAALSYQNNQLKAYIDQYRVLVVPDPGFKPTAIEFDASAEPENPIIIANVRLASGGGANVLSKLTTDGKLVTHGILFDVNQSAVKPPSMGTIAEIVKVLKANPSLKVEIGGHTDADGDAAKNLALSQARADAVRKILIEQGIDASRITAKGYGATKPIDKNDSPEGKANNRRVEFTKVA
jgi:outer membrane protein OmpA-like peptidoglycan-associated protein